MIPTPIYESLPFIYSGVGTYAVLSLEPTLGKVSGLLLISAALIIWHLRKKYRRTSVY